MKVVLLGSSGLVGGFCRDILALEPKVTHVHCLVRSIDSSFKESDKVHYSVVDFTNLTQYKSFFEADAVICCLGTTIKKAGNRKAFEAVDLQMPLAAGALAKASGVKHFLAISAMGANPHSWIHYNRTKGLMEEGLSMMGFESLTLVRPSLLLGDRVEKRRAEDLFKKFLSKRLYSLPAFFRPVHAQSVASAMILSLLQPPEGKRIVYNRKITELELLNFRRTP
ncbi:MAG TPA: NAD(P)H-binding protein [Fibrobacteraceae bacterium]|jgi:uncharacterized protein YbjT (DUF2867 family)|nr:NAD(P)H-binding protein [Fibrobacteraceae bacterium]